MTYLQLYIINYLPTELWGGGGGGGCIGMSGDTHTVMPWMSAYHVEKA